MSKPRQRLDAQTRRRQIMDAATRLFIEHGFAGVSMADIANVLNTSRPNIYVHFPSTKAILEALVNKKMSPILDRVDQKINEGISDDFAGVLEVLFEEKDFFLILYSNGGKDIIEHRRNFREAFYERISKELDKEFIRSNPFILDFVRAAFIGLIHQYALDETHYNAKELSRLFYQFITGGVRSLNESEKNLVI